MRRSHVVIGLFLPVNVLKFLRATIADGGVEPLAVVNPLNVTEDVALASRAFEIAIGGDAFGLERAKEAFCNSIVITVAGGRHAG